MKVGTLTFHRTTNYGAALQAYALQETISKLGNDVQIIDYNNKEIYSYNDYHIMYGNQSLKTRIGKVFRYVYNKSTFEKFVDFQKKWMNLSEECCSIEELKEIEKEFGAIICGSDQIWNPKAIFEDFEAYLLETVECRKISYAASAGTTSLWEPYLKIYWKLLHRFDAISVREKNMCIPTEHLSQKKVTVVLDPTLLLERREWEKLESSTILSNLPLSGYILVYFLGKNSDVIQAAQILQKKTGLPIISLGRKINGVKMIRLVAGPEEFLTLFRHAKYVLTSSFHGTIFSIQYQRPFLVFGNGAYNSRMNTLLETLNLQERMVIGNTSSIEEVLEKVIDWKDVEKRCQEEKGKSINFLKEALSENMKEM